jgi:hypothetical protein
VVIFLCLMQSSSSKAKAAVCIGTALPALAVAATHGCQEPTQVTLDIRTNVVCGDSKGVEIVVATTPHVAETRAALLGSGPRFATATTRECNEARSPSQVGTLVVTPSDDDNQAAVVVLGSFGKTPVEACLGSSFPTQCIVARRRFAFVDHLRIALPILLDPVCAGIPCDETSTCVGAKCVSSDVRCESGTCTEPGVAPDGGLVVVDAQGPINVTPVDDSGNPLGDGAPPPPNDGGGRDADAEAGSSFNDGGVLTGSCPNPTTTCAGNPAAICNKPAICCYVGIGAQCETAENCDRTGGCCRGGNDCNMGEVCCANTPTPSGASTRFSCVAEAACVAPMVAICTKVVAEGCGSKQCIGGMYSTTPDFFKCS